MDCSEDIFRTGHFHRNAGCRVWGDGSFGTKNSVKEYPSLFQLVAILISGLEASFGKNSEEDNDGISSTTIERYSLSHLNLNKSPDLPEGVGGSLADMPIGIAAGGEQRRHGCWPDLPEGVGGSPADIAVGIAEGGDQRRHGFSRCWPDLPEGVGGSLADI